jgi:hypothetical protein
LRLQHDHRETLMTLPREFGDTLIECGEFAKQSVKLSPDWRAPSLLFRVER